MNIKHCFFWITALNHFVVVNSNILTHSTRVGYSPYLNVKWFKDNHRLKFLKKGQKIKTKGTLAQPYSKAGFSR